jgi:transposase
VTVLAESIDAVIGVDSHRDTLAAAAVTAIGGVLAHLEAPANDECFSSLISMLRGPGAGQWKAPATTAPD